MGRVRPGGRWAGGARLRAGAGKGRPSPATHADVAWRFVDLMGQGRVSAALDHCADDVTLHVQTEGAEQVTMHGKQAMARFLARYLASPGEPSVRRKGLLMDAGRLAVLAATAEGDPILLRFALVGTLIREVWAEL